MNTILRCCVLFVLACHVPDVSAQTSLPGKWEGSIKLPGLDLGIIVHLKGTPDSLHGTIDIPMQMAMGLALTNVRTALPAVHFELPAGPGLASFDGTVSGDSIAGDFRQGSASGTFILHRKPEAPPAVQAAPVGYRDEEVHIMNGKVSLGGTLSLPSGGGPSPAVILLTGSGAQNRNEEIYGFAPFKIIADELAQKGFAVLRCDDRGVGESTGDMQSSTSADFADDAMAMFRFLAARPEIRKTEIGFLGHSEGAEVAAMCAAGSRDVAFLILLAGPAVPGDSTILSQIEVLGRLQGETPENIERGKAAERKVFAFVKAQKGWDGLRALLTSEMIRSIERLPAEQKAAMTNRDSLISSRVEFQMKALQSPWFKYFISHDPEQDLVKVRCPVLALFGELDKQVDPTVNSIRMSTALTRNGNPDVRVLTIPGANHLFQRALTGSPAEYAGLDKSFAEGVLRELSSWLKAHFR
jgi:pimeloyl-ACP methyl ester carboxylesterase